MTFLNGSDQEKFLIICKQRQTRWEEEFTLLPSIQKKYDLLIATGKHIFNKGETPKSDFVRVPGCQSKTFLKATRENELVFFFGKSDALISSGLLAILLNIYSGLPPLTVLTCPPKFIERIGFNQFLSLNRATGLYQIYLQIQKESARIINQSEM
ncbi:SufE family protein [Candidatus Similichlamydia epinepheli]|uniref:SufE family protein n=1 Tax=Candidatus Similichlamydia epinepheli TaxID=1903953 RepID=UPI000D378A66|nr:SufE family protein [Candidatus Similichlamydia epinepheli]